MCMGAHSTLELADTKFCDGHIEFMHILELFVIYVFILINSKYSNNIAFY